MDITKNFSNYISLHVHTIKSIGDSILKIDDYIEKAKEFNLKALSITNHGTMSDTFEFYNKCKKNDIKPIIGCEVYVTNDRTLSERGYDHLVLIAINKIGFENLLAIHNDAQVNGFYYKPRTDLSVLSTHGEGIIALSACVGGTLPQMILSSIARSNEEDFDESQEIENMIEYIETYKSVFDEFYLEIQPGDFNDQIVVNDALIELSAATNTKLIVTNDVHYLNEEDYLAHNIHVCAGRKQEASDTIIYPDKCYYMMDNDTLINSFKSTIDKDIIIDAISNAYDIINVVEDYDLIPDQIYMPNFDVPTGYNETSYLELLCFNALDKITYRLDDPAEYTERLFYELDVINKLGFSGYFLTVEDYVTWAKENHIQVGPGRGSICGSLVAYLINITKVDPIKYNLLFERFLSEHRPGVPDIDMDFDAKKRDAVFNYVVNKYGKDHCALVSTFSERKAKAALKDTGRAYGIPREIYEYVASLVPTVYYTDDEDGNSEKLTDLSIRDTIDIVPEFQSYYDQYPDWINSAINLSNIPKATSVHAAGTIIAPISLNSLIPLVRSKNEGLLATALNLKDAEMAGLIKYDFLSLSTLGVIDRCLKMIGLTDIYEILDEEYDDLAVWKTIGCKHTAGLFQISSATYRQRMGRLAPKSIKELAACLALVRGPCIASKADERYMKILAGDEEIELIHPVYDSITHETQGILIYQEQLMKICFKMGFTLDEGYTIMKLASKKDMDALKKYEKQFMKLAETMSMDSDTATRIFKMIVDSGLYSFNESHAIAYSILCYITAYLKTYHPMEFLAANLTNAYERKEPVVDLIADCRRLGFSFADVNINKSMWDFTLEEDGIIRIGFCAVKSFGEKAALEIMTHRPFECIKDVVDKVVKRNCGKRALIPAIFTGAFNDLFETRLDAYYGYCEVNSMDREEELSVQGSKEKISVYSSNAEFEDVFFGAELVSNPVNSFYSIGLDEISNNSSFEIKGLCATIKKHKDKSGNNMAFLNISTGDGSIEAVIFSTQYAAYKSFCKKGLVCDYVLKKNNNSYIVNAIKTSAA